MFLMGTVCPLPSGTMKYFVLSMLSTGQILSPLTHVRSPPDVVSALPSSFISGTMWASIISW